MIPGLGGSPGEGKSYPLQYSWPGEFHGLCSAWGYKESDTTERLSLTNSGRTGGVRREGGIYMKVEEQCCLQGVKRAQIFPPHPWESGSSGVG